jgi:14-3-3 protein epsilon
LKQAIDIVNKQLIPKAIGDQARIYFGKLKADYYRYMAEFAAESDQVPFERANRFYAESLEQAKAKLPATDPILLAVAVNFSLFLHDHVRDPQRAIQLVKETCGAYATAKDQRGDTAAPGADEEAALVGMLQENLTSWQ